MLDNKEYKKGLKHISRLHQTLPDQAEVMALKAIFLYFNDQQTEGLTLGKAALVKNMKSDFCWHIYGLINKASKNYQEAVKCFNQALKNDNDNLQLLRDLGNIQLHIRDYEGHAESRRVILHSKPNFIANWISFVVGNHLNGDLESALSALISSINVIQNDQQNKLKPVEENELNLYHITLLVEMNKYDEALQLIQKNKKQITDRISLNGILFQIHQKQGNKEEAIKDVKNLIELQPQNWNYYKQFLQANGLDEKNFEHFAQIQDLLLRNFKGKENNLVFQQFLLLKKIKSRRLGFCNVEEFKQLFVEFITPYFEKALPSLFKEIIHLYEQPEKILLMEEAYKEFLSNAHPTASLWAMMLLAQHNYAIKRLEEAFQWIEKAITHTPTLHELYLIKAKILKRQCKFQQAVTVIEYVRKLDLADRYLNNKAIKYSLNANLVYQGQELIRLFLKDSNESNPHEIQTIWYELGMGKAYARLNYYGPAFRMFKFIDKHFLEMYEDQIDFYSFSMRKYSIRSLFEMISYLDNAHNNRYYITASTLMIQYLLKYISVLEAKKQATEENAKKKLTAAEKKKLQKQKQKEEEERQLRNQFTIEGHIYTPEHREKLDLNGEKYLETLTDRKAILNEANNFAKVLVNITNSKFPKHSFQAYKTLSEFYILTERPALALKALKGLQKYQDKDTLIISHKHQLKILQYCKNILKQFYLQVITAKNNKIDPIILGFISEEIQQTLQTLTLEQYNKNFFDILKPRNILDEAQKFECFEIFEKQDQTQINQNLIKILETLPSTSNEVYLFLQQYNSLICEQIRPILQQKHPQLVQFYFEDPNIIWQNKQIEQKKQNETKFAELQQ